RLVADDMLVVSPARDGTMLAHPGTSMIKLKRHALQSLGRSIDGLVQEAPDEDKFLVSNDIRLATDALPLRQVHVLQEDSAAGGGKCVKLTGAAALSALVDHTFAASHLDVIGRRDAHFANCCRLASKVEVINLRRRRDSKLLPAT